jgi:uncharacterized membrane protein YqgA involved in biofilm formation
VTGTLINVGTVVVGGSVGSLVGNRIPVQMRRTLMHAVGLTTLVIGLQRALAADNVLVLLGAVAVGAVVGELLRIEDGLDRLGRLAQDALTLRRPWLPTRDSGAEVDSTVGQGFVTASLIFCVGPMTILGSFEDGLTGAYQTLALKATLDGITATLLASSLGWGVLLSAATVLCFQGALTLGAGALRGALSDPMIAELTAVGGLLILGIGLNILELTRIRVANLLPALVIAPALAGVAAKGG